MAVQELGQLDGRLAAEGHHHAHRLFHLDDVHDILGAQRLEVQPVGGIIVRGNSLRVVVDDDHLIAQLLQRPDAVDGGIVELNALTDTDGAGAQHHNNGLSAAGEGPGLAELVKGRIEIGRFGVKLRAAGVHHLVNGVSVRARQSLCAGEAQQRLVGIAHALSGLIMGLRQTVGRQCLFKVRHFFQLGEEPAVNAGDAEDLVHGDAGLQRLEHREQPVVIHPAQPLPDRRGVLRVPLAVQAVQSHLCAPDRLHQRHFKAGGNGHDLAGGLHLRSQRAAGIGKLIKGPLRHFDHDIVQRRLKAGAGLAGDVIFDFVQRVTQRDFCGDLGNGIAGGLGGQRGGTADAGIDLNDRVLKAVRVQSKLHITAAHNAKVGDDVQ